MRPKQKPVLLFIDRVWSILQSVIAHFLTGQILSTFKHLLKYESDLYCLATACWFSETTTALCLFLAMTWTASFVESQATRSKRIGFPIILYEGVFNRNSYFFHNIMANLFPLFLEHKHWHFSTHEMFGFGSNTIPTLCQKQSVEFHWFGCVYAKPVFFLHGRPVFSLIEA